MQPVLPSVRSALQCNTMAKSYLSCLMLRQEEAIHSNSLKFHSSNAHLVLVHRRHEGTVLEKHSHHCSLFQPNYTTINTACWNSCLLSSQQLMPQNGEKNNEGTHNRTGNTKECIEKNITKAWKCSKEVGDHYHKQQHTAEICTEKVAASLHKTANARIATHKRVQHNNTGSIRKA